MTNDERAAVAREATLQLVNEFTDGTVEPLLTPEARENMVSYINREYPAPAAPETVTVGKWVLTRTDSGFACAVNGTHLFTQMNELNVAMFDRIAADARELAANDKRIAELERERDEAMREALNADVDRIEARMNLEAMQAAMSQGAGHEAGATAAASEPLASESLAVTSPSPAPIPLGAVVTVAHDPISPFTHCAGYWRDKTGDTWADDGGLGYMLAALYRATHADAATVERVAGVFAGAIVAGFRPDESARRVLRAIGIQEVGQ